MIFIPFKDYLGVIGGPSTFLRNLKGYLDRTGFPYIADERYYKKAGSIFFPVSFNKRILVYFKSHRLPIIQRLDGVYYPSKHGSKYKKLNTHMMLDYKSFSDFIIFQSSFSRESCFSMFGEISEDKYKIITNGADIETFRPAVREFNEKKIVFVTAGAFRSIDMIEPAVKALDILKTRYPHIVLKVIGSFSGNINSFLNRDYIEYKGVMDTKSVASELQDSDIFIYTQLNPPCPNAVIEAVCCGLPVVGFNGGAMKEILFFQKELLSDAGNNLFQEYQDYDINDFVKKISHCIENYPDFRKLSLIYCKKFDMSDSLAEYVKVFKKF